MSRICERCGDYTATQMVSGEDLCVDCANRQSKLNAAERKASSHGIDYSELALGVEERDAELARLRAELEQARVQLAGCLCAAEGTGDADKVKQGDYAWTPALQRTVELRADLAEARADVQRFEAALDASQRELAEAERKLAVSETLRAATSRSGNEVAKSTLDYYAMEKRKARTWEERALKAEAALDVSQRELAEARAADVEADILDAIEAVCELADAEYVRYREQWAGLRESVIDDNARDIGKVRQWLTERDIVRKGGKARDSRRTIRALVVAFRDALHLTRRVASDDTWNLWLQLVQRQAHERRESERNQTSRD